MVGNLPFGRDVYFGIKGETVRQGGHPVTEGCIGRFRFQGGGDDFAYLIKGGGVKPTGRQCRCPQANATGDERAFRIVRDGVLVGRDVGDGDSFFLDCCSNWNWLCIG